MLARVASNGTRACRPLDENAQRARAAVVFDDTWSLKKVNACTEPP